MSGVRIPEEAILHILSYLDALSLARMAMVCKPFYRLHKCENLWKRLAKQKFRENLQGVEIPPTSSWRIYYSSKMVSN